MESQRINALKELSSQLPYKKLAEKITEAEFDEVVQFIEENDQLGHLEFEYKINRMHLSRVKTKNWTAVQELLSATNSRVHIKKKSS